MKIILIFLTLFQFSLSFAGSLPSYMVSVTNPSGVSPTDNIIIPTSGKVFDLWQHIHLTRNGIIEDTIINISGNEIDLFLLRHSSLPNDPPPPQGTYYSIAEFGSLNEGTYNLNYYYVPIGNTFPPSAANAPMFFVETIQFNVLGAIVIDSSSKLSLLLLMLLLLFTYRVYSKKFNTDLT